MQTQRFKKLYTEPLGFCCHSNGYFALVFFRFFSGLNNSNKPLPWPSRRTNVINTHYSKRKFFFCGRKRDAKGISKMGYWIQICLPVRTQYLNIIWSMKFKLVYLLLYYLGHFLGFTFFFCSILSSNFVIDLKDVSPLEHKYLNGLFVMRWRAGFEMGIALVLKQKIKECEVIFLITKVCTVGSPVSFSIFSRIKQICFVHTEK